MAKLLAGFENGVEKQECVYLVVVVVRVRGFRTRTACFASDDSPSLLHISTHQGWPLNPKKTAKKI